MKDNSGSMSDSLMLAYGRFLNKILMQTSDPFMKAQHKKYIASIPKKVKGADFFSRMKDDTQQRHMFKSLVNKFVE